MDKITIDVGVHTLLIIDLTNYDFTGVEKLILTIKNSIEENAPPVIEREFTTPELHTITISPEESHRIAYGAVYDFNRVNDKGERFKEGENGEITLRRGCGQCK